MSTALVLKSIFLFAAAGLCEIGGGYLVWLWRREHRPAWFGLVGDASRLEGPRPS